MENLDAVADKYLADPPVEIENDLLMNWYPDRIDNIYDLNATDHQLGHKRNYCRDTLRANVEEAGFRTTLEKAIYLEPLPLRGLKTPDDMDVNLQAMLKVGVEFPDLCVALLFELEPTGD